MPRATAWPAILGVVILGGDIAFALDKLPKGVACLLEDNAAELLPQLTNPGGDGGEGDIERDVIFSGKSGIKITVYQKYFNLLPGWAFRIREKPAEGEYRYLRFAWRSEGLTGIMLQLHDDRDWNIRYTAGANKFGWETRFVAQEPPKVWTAVTVDLFKDFGEREIHGIALTAFDGVGYFDHIYLGRSIADLDNIDATSLADRGPLQLSDEELETHYAALSNPDASVAYRSFWTLAAAGEPARSFLEGKIGGKLDEVTSVTIAQWLKQLDDDEYAIRERATAELTRHFHAARTAAEAELERTTSVEVRTRLREIAAKAGAPLDQPELARQQARRILQIIRQRVNH
jgi:hypothetical protein